jgi:anti-anti-sigma regulatory factor
MRPSGPMTIAEAARLHRGFVGLAGLRRGVALEMGDVGQIDGAGVQLLVALARALEDGGGSLGLRELTPAVHQVLMESGCGRLLSCDAESSR